VNRKTAIIIGGGPAGLTAAYELLDNSDIIPIVFEMSSELGGISKTVNYKGNRIDIGGHRFFSKSDRVMQWWENIFPLQGAPARDDRILGRQIPLSAGAFHREIGCKEPKYVPGPDPETQDEVMLLRQRLSRIYFAQRFFDYPVSLNSNLIINLGFKRVAKIGASYLNSRVFPRKSEDSLADFFINRFGRELYLTFFKDYTEKVWGIPCELIKPDWGAQRVKGLSLSTALIHAARSLVSRGARGGISQKNVETSLIEQFMYPKLGPGQLWEEVARRVQAHGGQVYTSHRVVGFTNHEQRILDVVVKDEVSGATRTQPGDYFVSSMPVKDLVNSFLNQVPEQPLKVARGLAYRDFLTVGLLLNKLKIRNRTKIRTINDVIPDNWIYVQEREVRLGRIQVFNNWSPYMVHDQDKVWLGLEYFCNEGDDLWTSLDSDMIALAANELTAIGIIDRRDVLDGVVVRMPKAYPVYFGAYEHFSVVRDYLDRFENLFLVGRNGMHKYNNADHSMLTAMLAVENVISGNPAKDNIWSVNTEEEYHEEN